jgi:ornithine cyclodeaminase/alanine dehydrogenase-like protein (mu-crystallin family)
MRAAADEITLFKSVGSAIEDLAAAMTVWRRVERAS